MSTPSDFQVLETVFESPEFDHQSMSPSSNILNLEDGLHSSDIMTTPETDKETKTPSPRAASTVMFIEPPAKRMRSESSLVTPPKTSVAAQPSIVMAPKFPVQNVQGSVTDSVPTNPTVESERITQTGLNNAAESTASTLASVPPVHTNSAASEVPESIPNSSNASNSPTEIAEQPGSSKQMEEIEGSKSEKGKSSYIQMFRNHFFYKFLKHLQ